MTTPFVRFISPAIVLLAGFLSSLPALADMPAKGHARTLYTIPLPATDGVEDLEWLGLRLRERYGNRLLVEADELGLSRLLDLGYDPLPVPRDPALPYAASRKADVFHDHAQVEAILADRAARFPTLTRLLHLGQSVDGRSIDMLKISDNPGQDEDEPELRVLGCHHGNELMSVEIALTVMDALLNGYRTNNRITSLVNDTEIYIAPLINPDGREREQRENAADVDLNRDYGYQWKRTSGSGDVAFSQPEVRAVTDQMLDRHYLMSLSFHTTAAYINYVWNYSPNAVPDEPLIDELSEVYAGPTGYVVTNGYDWYQTYGDTNDFSYGSMGVLDWTIETDNSDVPAVTAMNLEATLDLFDLARGGIAGTVTDADTGAPLQALILSEQNPWPVYSDPANGYFHRLVRPVNEEQTLWVFANGYEPKSVSGVLPGAVNATVSDIHLTKTDEDTLFALRVLAVSMHYRHTETPWKSLGPQDGEAFAMDDGGNLVLDFGQSVTVGDSSLTVHCSREEGETVKVFVSDSYWKDWVYIGEATGTQTLPLEAFGGLSLRYVRLEDQANVESAETDGFDLDAISLLVDDSSVDPDGDSDGDVTDGDRPSDGDETNECADGACYTLTQDLSDERAVTATGPWSFLDEGSCLARFHVCPVSRGGIGYDLTLRYDAANNVWQGPTGCLFQPVTDGVWQSDGASCGVDDSVTGLMLRRAGASACGESVACSDGQPVEEDGDVSDDDDDDNGDDDDDFISDDDDADDDDDNGSGEFTTNSSSGCGQQGGVSWLALLLVFSFVTIRFRQRGRVEDLRG